MKKLLVIISIFYTSKCGAQDYLYYHQGKQINFSLDSKTILIESKTITDSNTLKALAGDIVLKRFSTSSGIYNLKSMADNKLMSKPAMMAVIQLNQNLSNADYLNFINTLKTNSAIDYISPGLRTSKSAATNISEIFYVKLKEAGDISVLKAMAEKTNTAILGQDNYMPLWYTLSCNKKSMGNSLEMSKYFFETGNFAAAEPNFIEDDESGCPSDPLFSTQWNLNNTGQTGGISGDDINACNAWGITTGSPNITIGSVNSSITVNHPDFLQSNITLYNIEDGTATNPLTNDPTSDPSHGTACVGIMIAQQNNGIGLAGIAPDCKLLAVSFKDDASTDMQDQANAIEHAYPLCDVISCSFEHSSPSQIIDDAIEDALTQGRNFNGTALGTVVVFSSGNDHSGNSFADLEYPTADSWLDFPDLLVVGAMSTCYEKKWWFSDGSGHNSYSCNDGDQWTSCAGFGLDIVAPGESIPLLQNQVSTSPSSGAYGTGSGTSYAAPQVSAVAALILSLYPCLTEFQVGQLIDQAARKIGTYTYSTTATDPDGGTHMLPFGTWTSNVGYGMLDATASLNPVVNFSYLQNDDVTDAEKKYSMNFIQAGSDVNPSIAPGPYTVDNTANVEIKAQQYIEFEPGFATVAGGVMYAHIAQFVGDCNNWVPTMNKKILDNPNGYPVNAESLETPDVDNNKSSGITMLPNPFQNSFTVNFNVLTDGETASVKVFDLTGRLVYEQSGTQSMGLHSYNIPVSSDASLYIVTACMAGNCISQKMVKYENN